MTKETVTNGNTNKTKLFRGMIKSLHLKTEPCYFFTEPKSLVEQEQHLTITARGRVKVSRKFGKTWVSDEEWDTVIQKLVISVADTEKIFERISRYFAKEHETYFVCDGGTWDLTLTNTEGETFRFGESSRYDHKSELSQISKLIRIITGLKCIMGFDEDTETVLTPEEQERMDYLEDCGIFTEKELKGIREGLIKNIRIEDNGITRDKHICYCFTDGGVYRDISMGVTPNGGDYADAYYYDEKHKRASRENAYWIDIHEMRFDGEMVGSTLGFGNKAQEELKVL